MNTIQDITYTVLAIICAMASILGFTMAHNGAAQFTLGLFGVISLTSAITMVVIIMKEDRI